MRRFVARVLRGVARRLSPDTSAAPPVPLPAPPPPATFNGGVREFVEGLPSDQNAIDLFAGEWASAAPPAPPLERMGWAPLFADERITWLLEQMGGVEGKRILELGTLEAGHTTMLERAGAAEILSIEMNNRAYMKSLIMKEIMGLKRTRLVLGDFLEYMRRSPPGGWDLLMASGVLYHCREPIEALELMARHSRTIFLWTHYHDASVAVSEAVARKFAEPVEREAHGRIYRMRRYNYGSQFATDSGFCGGPVEYSHWLERDSLMDCLKNLGFAERRIAHDNPQHPNGPSLSILARRP